jgi:hypothetical protein
VADPIVFSGLTREQAEAIAQFHRDSGAVAEIVPGGVDTFAVLVTYPASSSTGRSVSAVAQTIIAIAPMTTVCSGRRRLSRGS